MAAFQELEVSELNNKFKRLIHYLGSNNSSGFVVSDGLITRAKDNDGNIVGPTERYKFEVEFAHILAEIQNGREAIIQKHIDHANALIIELILTIKSKGSEVTENE